MSDESTRQHAYFSDDEPPTVITNDLTRQERCLGAVLGAAIGDAMGHPTEFLSSVAEIRLPVNTSGAGMSEAYVHGFNLILEGVRQIRGTSTSQVEAADVSLVTSGEGVPTSAILFTKDA